MLKMQNKVKLTASGMMLDEVHSLLQKALRRKERLFVAQSVNELMAAEKDQLPWQRLVSFLFEDHCLAGTKSFCALYSHVQKNRKRGFVDQLLKTKTSRYAVCLPLSAMHTDYSELFLEQPNYSLPEHLRDLVSNVSRAGKILDANHVLGALWQAMQRTERDDIMIVATTLTSFMVCVEKRHLTEKGTGLVQKMLGSSAAAANLGVTHVALAVMKDTTRSANMGRFLFICAKFASLEDAPVRLILFTALAKRLHGEHCHEGMDIDDVDWENVSPLSQMPDWAIDKHTFRGKNVSASPVKDKPLGMNDEQFIEFHGQRSYATLSQWRLPCLMQSQPLLAEDPYLEKGKWVIERANRQTTEDITEDFYLGTCYFPAPLTPMWFADADNHMPLLQLPTSSSKVYVRLNIQNAQVIKGPYTRRSASKYRRLISMHKVLKALGDMHTLPLKETVMDGERYVVFPLMRNDAVDLDNITVHKTSFTDKISNVPSVDVQFVSRESLGLEQGHRMTHADVRKLPWSLWIHFAYRFALNIGDSGLHNVLSNGKAVVGIDMDERRGTVSSQSCLCDLLFSRKPQRELCGFIEQTLRTHAAEARQILTEAKKTEASVNAKFRERIDQICAFLH